MITVSLHLNMLEAARGDDMTLRTQRQANDKQSQKRSGLPLSPHIFCSLHKSLHILRWKRNHADFFARSNEEA